MLKRRKNLSIDSDSHSESDELGTDKLQEQEVQPNNSPRRHSSRILSKTYKPDFKLPTRESVWKDIPSLKLKSPEKLRHFSPRKSVNDFTKVYNTYNFDDYEDTGDEEDSYSSSSSSSDSNDQTPRRRVKNYRKRIRLRSSSSDEAETKAVSDPDVKSPQPENAKDTKSEANTDCEEPKMATLNTQVTRASGNISDGTKSNVGPEAHKNNPSLEDSDSSDGSEENITPGKKISHGARRSMLDSETESEKDDSTSDETDTNIHQRSENLKQKQKNLFSDFKDAIAKRKSRLGSQDLK